MNVASCHFYRIGVVNPIDLCGFQNDFGLDLHGAESGRGVGGKIRVARAGSENHDALLLQMADRAAADVHFGHLAHLDGGLHAV